LYNYYINNYNGVEVILKSTTLLENYKREFEQLYEIAEDKEVKDQIEICISEIKDLMKKQTLADEMINLYCNFYGQLISIMIPKLVTVP
jgi:Ulp1 family protease